jgi:hypothetical protein
VGEGGGGAGGGGVADIAQPGNIYNVPCTHIRLNVLSLRLVLITNTAETSGSSRALQTCHQTIGTLC